MSTTVSTPHPLIGALSNRNFVFMWIGGSISVLGSQFSMIALPWLILQLTNDPQAVGFVLALAGLPRALFMLMGGAITDRISPRMILLVCDWLNFVLAALIAALVITHTMQVWMVYVFSLLTGLISGFVIPAANTIAPLVLDEKDLQAGNSLSMSTGQLMGFAGPALAGIIIGSYNKSIEGVALAFAIDAVSFAISAMALGLMSDVSRPAPKENADQKREDMLQSIWEATRYLAGNSSLRLIFLVISLVNLFFTGPLLVGIPVLADQRLGEGAAGFGWLMSAYAGGNLLGYLLAGALPKPTGRTFSLIMVSLVAAFGVILAALGWITSLWLDFGLMLALGVGNGYVGLILFTWIQNDTPREMLGRMMSMVMLSSMGLVPISQAIAGSLLKWNLTGLFVFSGASVVMVAIWMAFNPALKDVSEAMLGMNQKPSLDTSAG